MKLTITWFNITSITKRSSHTFDMADDVRIPMIETKQLHRTVKYHNYDPGYILAYLGTYRKFTKQL